MEEQKKEIKKKWKFFWMFFGIFSFFIIVFLLIYLIAIWQFFGATPSQLSDEPGYIPFTKSFHQVVQQRLKAKKIRQWMATLDEQKFDGKLMRVESLPFKLPIAIRCLEEDIHYITLFMNQEGNRCIDVEWGGPVAHWGVVIGPKEMPIPPTIDVSYDKDGFRNIGEYRIKVEDGAYVWHEIK
ncbi:MAG: hypothetical protein ACYTEU_05525 [Planctomycetota bacterium]|jgi:hypothetical protein